MNKNGIIVILILVVSVLNNSYSQSREEKRLKTSTDVFNTIAADIPDSILKRAQGIIIIPNIVKAGAGLGGFLGQGVMSTRMSNGCWSNPAFASFKGATVGFQAGGQNIDMVLIFTNAKTITEFTTGKLILGSSASVEAGPIKGSARKNIGKSTDIVSYVRSKGVSVGATMNGASLNINEKANKSFYKSKNITSDKILQDQITNPPKSTAELKKDISALTGGCK